MNIDASISIQAHNFEKKLFVSALQLQIIWISKMKAVLGKQTMETERICIINVGLFRSGTTFLAEGAKELGLQASDVFPPLSDDDFNGFLHKPKKLVRDWYSTNGLKKILDIILKNDIICDGWFALLPFLPSSELEIIKQKALENRIKVEFVATSRDVKCAVTSELQHWVIHDLEQKAKLTDKQRENLEKSIFRRLVHHDSEIKYLEEKGILSRLQLRDRSKWSRELSLISTFDETSWSEAFQKTGIQNANPVLPIEGVLLTFRLGNSIEESKNKVSSIEALLNQIEEDSICQYLLVLGIDADEAESDASRYLQQKLKSRLETNPNFRTFHVLKNQPYEEAFNICSAWNEMAVVAWENNASWVVLLGDDIELQCSYHYRAFYRNFLDIAKHLNVPLGFGCPWWNDVSFPRFPSFPCVGKAHFEIFDQLIPKHRQHNFVNQDLDPYLHRLYCKFMASPCVLEATLSNKTGGKINSSGEQARYKRVSSGNWKDFVEKDTEPIKKYLQEKSNGALKEAILLDVVVPSYRVRLDYLEKICCLNVPNYMQTLFIIIVDNPNALINAVMSLIRHGCHNDNRETIDLNRGESVLEEYLSSKGGNDVRVRCNKTNLGASASRNRGLDESSANFVLNLDDDLIPNTDLLFRYGCKLRTIESDVCGLVGLVKFPRAQDLHLKHAAVLMSYLTFMFEIAETSKDLYGGGPAWGVTANILFKRTPVRFDKVYAKTGGKDCPFSFLFPETVFISLCFPFMFAKINGFSFFFSIHLQIKF